MPLGTAMRLAAACGVSVEWLGGAPQPGEIRPEAIHDSLPVPANDTAYIDFYDIAASAGFGRHAGEGERPRKVAISKDFLRRELGLTPDRTIMLQVSGDSMEPTLRAGDKVIVDTSRRQLLDGIHVLVSDGALLVKRLSDNLDGTIGIISDNDIYPQKTAEDGRFRWGDPDGGDAITVVGRVAFRLQAMS